MLCWVRDVWKSIIGQKFRGLWEIWTPSVQKLFEVCLLLLEFLLRPRPDFVARMHYKDYEVYVEVELQLLAVVVWVSQFLRNQFVPHAKEIVFETMIKCLGQFVQHHLRINALLRLLSFLWIGFLLLQFILNLKVKEITFKALAALGIPSF